MWRKILGVIGILWGGAIIISFFLRKAPLGNGAGPYAAGAAFGFLLGAVMLVAGIHYVRK